MADHPLDISAKEFKKQLKLREQNRAILIDWIKRNLKPGIDYMRIWSNKYKKWSKPFLLKPGAEKITGMMGVTPTFPNLKEYEERFRNAGKDGYVNAIVIMCQLVNGRGLIVSEGVGARLLNEQDQNDLNKSLKMALKSSQIDATLRYGGLSEVFSQEPESETDNIEKTITDIQCQELLELISKSPLKPEKVAEYFGVANITLLPVDFYFRAKKAIQKKINDAKHDDIPVGEKK